VDIWRQLDRNSCRGCACLIVGGGRAPLSQAYLWAAIYTRQGALNQLLAVAARLSVNRRFLLCHGQGG
jgi:hypothetical protein